MDTPAPPEGTFARLQQESSSEHRPGSTPSKRSSGRPDGRSHARSNSPTNGRTDERTSASTVYTIQVPEKRQQVRHAFNIFRDQYETLQKLQLALAEAGGERPQLGHMVQQAIDLYVQRAVKQLPNVQLHKPNKR